MASDPTTVALFRLTEPDATIHPRDATGYIEDLAGDSGSTPALTVPAVDDGLLGLGRAFTTDVGLIGQETTAGAGKTRLMRDCTIDAIAEYDIASASVGDAGVIVARGVSGSAAERTLYGLQVVKLNTSLARIQMVWEESGGTAGGVAGRQFDVPTSGFLYLWATRRWISATEVIVTYGVNDYVFDTITSITGDIGNGDDGTLTIGCRGDGSGNYQDHFEGIIDQVRVTDGVRSPEEMRATYRRIAAHQPNGYKIIRSLLPGKVYSEDPDSAIQRELMVEGDGIGQALAKIHEIIDDGLPDRAWSLLDRWEEITKLFPKYNDSWAVRRARVLSFLSTVHGYSADGVKAALAEVFDLATTDVAILNYENEYTDAFATALADYWSEVAGNGAIAIASGELEVSIATATDGRWETSEAPHVRQSIDGDALDDDPAVDLDATVKIVSRSLADTSFAGMIAVNADREVLALGHYNNAATYELRWGLYSENAWTWTVIDTPAPALPTWVRMTFNGGTDWDLRDSQVSADEAVAATGVTGIALPIWVGLAVITTAASPAALSEMHFDDWRLYTPNGLRVFNWYAYRDPALSGTPDMPGARRIVAQLKPAETEAGATQIEAIECDDAYSLCDDGPIGA